MKKLLRAIGGYLRGTDRWLWLFCIGLSVCSVVMLCGIWKAGISSDLADDGSGIRKLLVQAGASLLGMAAAVVLSKFDYHTLAKLWKLHVPAAYGLVLLTFFIGVGTASRPGDKSWLVLPGGMTLQPTEFLKLSFILALAYHLSLLKDNLNRPANLALVCLHGAAPVVLIHFQGDDGTAIVFAALFLFMVFAAGVHWKYILAAGGLALAAAPVAWFTGIINDDQKQRILGLFDPTPSQLAGILYQQNNARLAIGSGQVWGKGIFGVEHLYVPEIYNDFIFAFIGESLGFVGCLAVIAVFVALGAKLLHAGSLSEDPLGRYICAGLFGMLACQCLVNIGMCIMVLPVIGITLPFLSYGGSSVLATYMGMGLALSVYMHSNKRLFS